MQTAKMWSAKDLEGLWQCLGATVVLITLENLGQLRRNFLMFATGLILGSTCAQEAKLPTPTGNARDCHWTLHSLHVSWKPVWPTSGCKGDQHVAGHVVIYEHQDFILYPHFETMIETLALDHRPASSQAAKPGAPTLPLGGFGGLKPPLTVVKKAKDFFCFEK